MKAVVVEIKNKTAAVLKEDGTFAKYYGPCEVGDEVEIEEGQGIRGFFIPSGSKKRLRQFVSAAAAAAAIAVGLGSYGYVYAAPVAYVSMDAASSVEFALNRRGEAIAVEAVNEDAIDAVAEYNSRRHGRVPLGDAVRVMTDIFYEEKVLGTGEQTVVSVNVASDNEKKNEALLEAACAAVEEIQDAHREQPSVFASTATAAERKEARKEGITAGTYKARQMGGTPESPMPEGTLDNGQMGSGQGNPPQQEHGTDENGQIMKERQSNGNGQPTPDERPPQNGQGNSGENMPSGGTLQNEAGSNGQPSNGGKPNGGDAPSQGNLPERGQGGNPPQENYPQPGNGTGTNDNGGVQGIPPTEQQMTNGGQPQQGQQIPPAGGQETGTGNPPPAGNGSDVNGMPGNGAAPPSDMQNAAPASQPPSQQGGQSR